MGKTSGKVLIATSHITAKKKKRRDTLQYLHDEIIYKRKLEWTKTTCSNVYRLHNIYWIKFQNDTHTAWYYLWKSLNSQSRAIYCLCTHRVVTKIGEEGYSSIFWEWLLLGKKGRVKKEDKVYLFYIFVLYHAIWGINWKTLTIYNSQKWINGHL